MNVTDVLVGVLGGSGLFGVAFTYLQFRQQRIEERRKHVREMALTPAFRKWLGATTIITQLCEEIGKTPKDNLEQLRDLLQIVNKFHWQDLADDPEFFSSLYFLPKHLQAEIFDLTHSAKEFIRTSVQSLQERKVGPSMPADLALKFDRLSNDLKKELGIE
jgi:hypothetical protein